MAILQSSDLDHQLRVERKLPDEAADAAGSEEWVEVATVWAQVRDILPSRGEQLADGLTIATRPARVRLRWRDDVTAAMRFVSIADGRVLAIIAGPAELGRREGMEFMAETYSSAGNG